MDEPFDVPEDTVLADPRRFVPALRCRLTSSFLFVPSAASHVSSARFGAAYEVVKETTRCFQEFGRASLLDAIRRDPLSFVVVRAILGLTPSEWAYLATTRTGIEVSQGVSRTYNKRAIESGRLPESDRLFALLDTACDLVAASPEKSDGCIHRLDKIDTHEGLASLCEVAAKGSVRYSELLFERFLGRPFATVRDANSERVGEVLEDEIEDRLRVSGVPYHRTQKAERFEDLDQAPDFLIPSASRTAAVIEAKYTEDDGTARDKVTRIVHLRELSEERERAVEGAGFAVIAVIDGRGFGVRSSDIEKVLLAARGKVFTLATLDLLVPATALSKLAAEGKV